MPAPAPAPAPAPTPVAAEPSPSDGYGAWLWLLGALIVAGLAYLGWRRSTAATDPIVGDDEAAAAPVPAPQPSPPVVPRSPAPTAPALAVEFRPLSFRTQGPDAVVAFELAIANRSSQKVEAVRTLVALTSAAPDISDRVAAFAANAAMATPSPPFDLAPGESQRMSGELTLPGDAMFVTEQGDRALIVPIGLVHLRWRDGLSLRSRVDNFMIGTGDAGAAKLGPVRVDRPAQIIARLAARRFDMPAG